MSERAGERQPIAATVPVLMYHAVAEHPTVATHRLSVHPDTFAAQLALLRRDGFTTVTFSALNSALAGGAPLPERPVVLTFDDGYADLHEFVLPLLALTGCTATVFVTTGWLADAGARRAGRPLGPMLGWGQVAELASAGIEIGAHSHSHAELDLLADRDLRRELRTSKELLEDRIGVEVPALAYPFGYSSGRVRDEACAAGYRHAAAVSNACAAPHHDRFAVPRLTVRRSTGLDTFARVVHGRRIAETYALDRVLTAGWSVVRRSRYPR